MTIEPDENLPPVPGGGGESHAPPLDAVDVSTDKANETKLPELPYDRETIRADLARGLLWLLTLTVGGAIFFVGMGQLKGEILTQSIFPSLVTLTGTALGFYFGSESKSKG
jgi:hypothetical protein